MADFPSRYMNRPLVGACGMYTVAASCYDGWSGREIPRLGDLDQASMKLMLNRFIYSETKYSLDGSIEVVFKKQ